MAKVEGIHFNDKGIDMINKSMVDSGYTVRLKRRTVHFNYTYKGKIFKSTFPLALAYAMTEHEAQVVTIASLVLVDVSVTFKSHRKNICHIM